ncbi:DNA recombination protein RmuC [Candidatus Termititenax aidoneus]|uniref:DNA recombination protein RmuC n=1 Tax=Termititenax aidoneus TaxID=2218524 RepID=A0A388T9A7_TERA1|nr:DNA recombination protein RmuC [Candidatus Termititenax aidoneus]
MEMAALILICSVFLLAAALFWPRIFGKKENTADFLAPKLADIDKLIRDEFSRNRQEMNAAAKDTREELAKSLRLFADSLEKIRAAVENKLRDIQTDNNNKLEQMRATVDEKLHQTLETRLGESFKLVSERLELVQKGLGEMQSLAAGVGDLKKVLSNVKTKGVLGEYQLGGILEQILSPSQYAQNVKIKPGSRELVEFAVKIPSKADSAKIVWLPIDAKFPTEDYDRLLSAYDSGDLGEIELHKKELEKKLKTFARDIAEKYIDPPQTTDFALLFLPFEGLYAEVLRIPNLFESLQRDYKIVITGPTTISAFLNSLQIGFRSLAVEKRTSEIWDLLGAVRTEFGKFGDVLQKTKDKLDAASSEIEKAGARSRAIERKLRDVQELPETAAQKLLGDLSAAEAAAD